MKIAIMQPYFFPYLGYFQLINEVDLFILFDIPQFIRHGWIERNNILKPNGEKLYIKVPLKKHHRNTAIKDVFINNEIPWRNKIFAQLVPYKKKAPYYFETIKLLNKCFKKETESIVDLNFIILKEVSKCLEIDTKIKILSKINLDIGKVTAPDEWALQICKALNYKEYVNPIGGKNFFNVEKYELEKIEVKFLESHSESYQQFGNRFSPCLSIIDVLMFCGKEKIKKMTRQYELT